MKHGKCIRSRRIVAALEIVCLGHRVIEAINSAIISKYCNFSRHFVCRNETQKFRYISSLSSTLLFAMVVSLELWIARMHTFNVIVLRNWLRNYTRCVFSCRCSVIECGAFFFFYRVSHSTHFQIAFSLSRSRSLDSLELIYLPVCLQSDAAHRFRLTISQRVSHSFTPVTVAFKYRISCTPTDNTQTLAS